MFRQEAVANASVDLFPNAMADILVSPRHPASASLPLDMQFGGATIAA